MLKKAVHRLRHTRPQWYKDYHEWEHHGILHWSAFIVSCAIITLSFFSAVIQLTQKSAVPTANAASTANTQVRQSIIGGALTIAQNGDQRMATATASINHQDTHGNLGTITVTDSRGTAAGWTAYATSSNFYAYNEPVNGATTSGTWVNLGESTVPFATSSAGTYTITIEQGGAVGAATFNVTSTVANETNQYGVSTGSGNDVPIGSYNLTLDFTPHNYVSGESWTVRVDTIPVERFRITPGAVTPVAPAVTTGLTPGALNFFDSPTENVNLIVADLDYGMGQFTQSPDLDLGIPSNSYINDYTARIILTVN